MKKTIAVIGAAGAMGSALSKSLAHAGHHILLMDKNIENCHKTYDNILSEVPHANVEILHCIHEGSWEADVIILSVCYEAQGEVAEYIKDVVTGKVIISIVNPLDKDKKALLTSHDKSAAEELQKLLPYSKVIKAFNTNFPANFGDGKSVDCFIAGDDEAALTIVTSLVEDAGFNPQVAGNLSASRILESMMLILAQLYKKNNLEENGGFKIIYPIA